MIHSKDFDEFVGDKLDKFTMTFSFRLSISAVERLLNGETVHIKIKGKEFKLTPSEVI